MSSYYALSILVLDISSFFSKVFIFLFDCIIYPLKIKNFKIKKLDLNTLTLLSKFM